MSSDFLSQNDFNAAKIGKNPETCKRFLEIFNVSVKIPIFQAPQQGRCRA